MNNSRLVKTIILLSPLVFFMFYPKSFRPVAHLADSCSTFVLKEDHCHLIAHNLDDYIKTPGLIFINKRGVAKENITWSDLKSFWGKDESGLKWISKYGSVTYNTIGKEFIDGGMNEAGLYVGEMTLFGAKYPNDKKTPKMYHHQWMQYLLDNYSTVNEVLANLAKVNVDGHCQWHFFTADEKGDAAVIEFLEGQTLIRTGNDLPYPILCNRTYNRELDSLYLFQDFGGRRQVDFADSVYERRFVWAAKMLKDYSADTLHPPVDYAFRILKQLDSGDNNKWSIVYDVKAKRMYFHTVESRRLKTVDMSQFDFSCATPIMIYDINRDAEGDVTADFILYTEPLNKEYIKKFWEQVNMGFFWGLFKPGLVANMNRYTQNFSCTEK